MISIHESSFPTGPKGTFTEDSSKLETCGSKSQAAAKSPAWKLLCVQNALAWNKKPFFHGQFFISFEFAKCRRCNMLTSNTWSQLSDCVQCGSVARLRFKIKESAGPSPVTIGTELLYDPATQVLPGILRFWFTACFWFAFRQWLSHVVSLLRKKCCREFQPFPSMANPVAWHVFSSIATLSNKSISLIVCKI